MASTGQGPPPGQPTPQQLAQMAQMQAHMQAEARKRGLTVQEFQKQQLEAEAGRRGMTPQQYITQLRAQAMQRQMGAQVPPNLQPGQPGQPVPVVSGQGPQGTQQQQVTLNPGMTPKPEALAVAKFLRAQNLKTRTCILDGQRKDMFKVKRALRALQSSNYTKARSKKNSLLPEVKDDATARQALQLLPLSMLALRVTKIDPHEGHNHEKPKKDPKRVKGLWTVKVERNQDFEPLMHYVWLYEGSQWRQKAMAVGALVVIMAVVMFPLWPLFMRQGVWYLSVGMMGLLGLFFAMAIFRLILFAVTIFVAPPGLWLFPNLFEDVGFWDSFKPLWGWQEDKKAKKAAKRAKKAEKAAKAKKAQVKGETPAQSAASTTVTTKANGTPPETTTESKTASSPTVVATKRHQAPQVEEAEDE